MVNFHMNKIWTKCSNHRKTTYIQVIGRYIRLLKVRNTRSIQMDVNIKKTHIQYYNIYKPIHRSTSNKKIMLFYDQI